MLQVAGLDLNSAGRGGGRGGFTGSKYNIK